MDMNTMMDAWMKIFDTVKNMDALAIKPVLCMMIDLVAAKNGENAGGMLRDLLPIVDAVNGQYGAMEI